MNISIVASEDPEIATVNVSGGLRRKMRESDRETMRLEDADIKAFAKDLHGKDPDVVFIGDPTTADFLSNPGDDMLFDGNNTEEAGLQVIPISATVLDITSVPTIIATSTLENNSDIPAEFEVNIEESVSNSVESNWSEGGSLSFDQTFSYGVSFFGSGGGGSTSLGFESNWSQGGSETTEVTLTTGAAVKVTLQPGETVFARLNASRGKMVIEVKYRVLPTGKVQYWYKPPSALEPSDDVRGRTPDALRVSKFGLNNNFVQFTETIEIGFFSSTGLSLESSMRNYKVPKFIPLDEGVVSLKSAPERAS